MGDVIDFNKAMARRGPIVSTMVRIRCPSCHHEYEAMLARVNSGGSLTCGKCGFAIVATVKINTTKE